MKTPAFPVKGDFYKELRQRVNEYFEGNGLKRTGNLNMYLKTVFILLWLAISYIFLVFFSESVWMAVISAAALSQGFVLVGFNIMHDANHGSYSKNRKLNNILGFTLDLIGGSSVLWKQKHNILHHTYTNISGLDEDIESNGLLRLSPNQEWKSWHRFQYLYAFPVYSLLTISWILFSDFKKFFRRRIGEYQLKHITKSETVLFFLSKLIYLGYMILIPAMIHPLSTVLIFFLGIHLMLGFTLSIVFQLAHTLEENTFPKPNPNSGNIENEWAIHQIETTADFAPRNWLAAWYLGGLNFQVEHHLFANICHVHYPAVRNIVKEISAEYGVNYVSFPSVLAAVFAHLKFLYKMGRKPVIAMA